MNKKFSTLVAALLVAGAWTTLDAAVVKVATPKVGGSYMIGSAVAEGDAANGKVTDMLLAADAKSSSAAVVIQTYGKDVWTLEAVPAGTYGETDVTDWFYLKSGTEYLIASSSVNNDLAMSSDGLKKYAVPFKIVGEKFVVAQAVVNGSFSVTVDYQLKLNNNAVATAADGTGTDLAFGVYEADKTVTFAGTPRTALANYEEGVYYFIGALDGKLIGFDTETNAKTGTVVYDGATGTNIDNIDKYLWKIEKTEKGGVITYSFKNKEFDTYAKVGNSFDLIANQAYNSGFSLSVAGKALKNDFTQGDDMANQVAFGIYPANDIVATATELNNLLNGGFNLSFKADKDGKIAVDYTSAFDGKLFAKVSGSAYQIMSGDDFVVLEKETSLTSGITGAKGKFVKVTADELKDNAAKYLSYFQITRNAGKATSAVGTLTVAAANDMNDARYAYIPVTDGKDGKTAVLTTIAKENFKAEEAPIITLSASDMVPFKDLLGQFMSISFVKDEAEAKAKPKDIVYKRNGILSTVQYAGKTTAEVDYVDNSTVLANAPEVQWAISSVNEATGLFTLTNRESGEELEGVSFRKTDKAGEWIVETVTGASDTYTGIIGDVVKVYLFDNKNITMFDGFQTYTPNELRNIVFNIGQYHNETENAVAYWAENHQSNASHQLGVVADEAKATNWRLRLDQRYEYGTTKENGVVDTIFIETPMATYQKGKLVQGNAGDKDVVVSRLAVLPYQFQNKGNLEYVKYATGTNLNYYVCDDQANVETNANRFALKMKPNGFNIVALSGNGVDGKDSHKPVLLDELGSDKIYAGNSDEWGNLKKVASYTPDDNSIMVVKPIDRPEYRKVAKEWGDIVKIFRQEYPTEVLFEKRDAKSVVDKDTLSFLNVNNSITGANPALFVDTAYVNRVDADGVKNTCYQYLLAVNVNKDDTYHCPLNPLHDTQAWRDEFNGGKPCPDAVENPAMVKGRFLINLIDTAYAYKQDHLHNNPYINMVEADENKAKLSFVEGIHVGDTLYITRKGGEVVKLAMDSPEFNVAKFAFRYVNNAEGSFKIQTQYKEYEATSKEAFEKSADNEGYLRWVNGTVVVTNSYTNGETFNMEENYDGQAVANEDITTSAVKVTTTEGKVIIAGAQGKKVTISNVLGQTVANAVLSSDKAEIATPSGVVIVAVEGEAAVKAIVK
ncbi:MAG: DUF6383 domain-containing protein [Parabacteroides gordonii]|uniref:DUF6383 domain-containing protein n=1 Tax=Parabacteroides gordonii TaxID=574930 RepID=UPI003A87AE0B